MKKEIQWSSNDADNNNTERQSPIHNPYNNTMQTQQSAPRANPTKATNLNVDPWAQPTVSSFEDLILTPEY